MKDAKKYGHRYPWREWLATEHITLVRGVHFPPGAMVHGVAAMARNACSRLKAKRHIYIISEDRIEISQEKKNGQGSKSH